MAPETAAAIPEQAALISSKVKTNFYCQVPPVKTWKVAGLFYYKVLVDWLNQ